MRCQLRKHWELWQPNTIVYHIDDLVQDSSIASALIMEILESCSEPSIFCAAKVLLSAWFLKFRFRVYFSIACGYIYIYIYIRCWFIHSSPHSAAYMRQFIGSALVQIMGCHLFGTESLSEPMLSYCLMESQEQTSAKFQSKHKTSHQQKMHLKTSSAKWRPFCPGGDE